MTLALKLAIRGRLAPFQKADELAYKRSATSVIRRKTNQLKRNLQRNVERGTFRPGAGKRLSKDIASLVYPRKGTSAGAAGQVFTKTSKAKRARSRRFFDAISFFETGGRVQPRAGTWLAIPTDQGRLLGGALKNAPRIFSPSTSRLFTSLQFIPSKDRRSARLVLKKRPSVTVFILVRPFTLAPRVRPMRPIYERVGRNIPELTVSAWERFLKTELAKVSGGRS